jgi:predicted phosphodiesterase
VGRIAIISDIHANLEALEAVLADLEKKKASKIYCLGDIVGYGPSPREVLEIVKAVANESVRGNHEILVCRTAPNNVHPDALKAAEWTRKKLLPGVHAPEALKERWGWLKALPATEDLGEILLAHGTPRDCFTYVLAARDAERVFDQQMGDARILFIGHSHVPAVWYTDGGPVLVAPGEKKKRYTFAESHRIIVNVGSVGQPRDHDPRACYVLLHDDLSFEYRRVEYDCEKTAKKIFDIPELPNWLGERLLCGE